MTKEFEKKHPFVKIKVSNEMIVQLFGENNNPTICCKGLQGNYKCIGLIQNSSGMFEFLLKNNYAIDGMESEPFMPVYERIKYIDKQIIINAIIKIEQYFKDNPDEGEAAELLWADKLKEELGL